MNLVQAQLLAEQKLQHFGLVGWKVKMNPRLTRALGRCCYHPKTIELQPAHIELNNEDVVLDTILHEIAHALVGPGNGHGPKWKAMAVKVGAKPQRCADPSIIVPKAKYQLAIVDKSGVEYLEYYSQRKANLSGRMLKGRPETLNKLFWIPAK